MFQNVLVEKYGAVSALVVQKLSNCKMVPIVYILFGPFIIRTPLKHQKSENALKGFFFMRTVQLSKLVRQAIKK